MRCCQKFCWRCMMVRACNHIPRGGCWNTRDSCTRLWRREEICEARGKVAKEQVEGNMVTVSIIQPSLSLRRKAFANWQGISSRVFLLYYVICASLHQRFCRFQPDTWEGCPKKCFHMFWLGWACPTILICDLQIGKRQIDSWLNG